MWSQFLRFVPRIGAWLVCAFTCLPLAKGELAPTLLSTPMPPAKKIVIFLVDDFGIVDTGCYGSDYYETPAIDKLAQGGMRFTDAYAASPVCSPTRASLLTGRYPHRLHLTCFIPGLETPYTRLKSPDWIKYLRDSETTFAEAFTEAGYETFFVGKWHLGAEYAGNESPRQHGFSHVHPGGDVFKPNPEDPHFVREYTQATIDFLDQHASDDFLVYVSYDSVHYPIYEEAADVDHFRDKAASANGQDNPVMAAMIAKMDWSVGEILNQLDKLGIADETLVLFLSDNGGLMSYYDNDSEQEVTATSNLPYRGGKSKLYEGGIRIPFIVRWPGVVAPASTCDDPVITNDVYPTLLDAAGLEQRPEQHLDGIDLCGVLTSSSRLPERALFWHYPHYHTEPPHGAVRDGEWKLIWNYQSGEIQLFNLDADPGEQMDLSGTMTGKAGKLQQMLKDHLAAIGAQWPVQNPGYEAGASIRQGATQAPFDPYESQQENDPRTYSSNPL